MKFLRKYFSQLIFLVIGLLAGFFISWLPIEFEEKINKIGLFNLMLTLLLALYLEFKVRPSFSNNRNEKDILIDQLKEIKEKAIELHDSYIELRDEQPLTGESKSKLLQGFRILSNNIDLFKQADEYCTITKKTQISDAIVKHYLTYKKSLTGHSFNDSAFHYDRLYWTKQEQSYKSLIKSIILSVIDVNKI